MRLSVLIVTHDRREALLNTLSRLRAGGIPPSVPAELILVDDASTDGTVAAVRARFPEVRVLPLERSAGAAAARNRGIAAAQGQYVLFLDDDSYPLGDAVPRMLDRLEAHPEVGVVSGRVELPDGSSEASALPGVFIACAACARRMVLEEVGGFPEEFFRQAEEYDLSFRVWAAGHRVERVEDAVFQHEKAAGARGSAAVCRLDLRNNLVLTSRYLPPAARRAYRADWLRRYALLARHHGCGSIVRPAVQEARTQAMRDAGRGRRILNERAFESLFGHRHQAEVVGAWAKERGLRRVAIADFSKNLYATYRACLVNELVVSEVLDNHPAFAGTSYRGLAIVPDTAMDRSTEGIVLSNVNPAQMPGRAARLRRLGKPVLELWEPGTLGSTAEASRRREPVTAVAYEEASRAKSRRVG